MSPTQSRVHGGRVQRLPRQPLAEFLNHPEGRFCLENVLYELEHLGRHLHVRDIVEVVLAVAQRRDTAGLCLSAPYPGLKHDDPLALVEHDPAECGHALPSRA